VNAMLDRFLELAIANGSNGRFIDAAGDRRS
jgi:hypothetical protein